MAERNTLVALAALTRVGGPSLVALFVLDALSRAILVTVVAFEALAVLGGDAQKVSVLYAAISAAGEVVGNIVGPVPPEKLESLVAQIAG